MRVYFGQIYIKPGVRFPFSVHFQRYLSATIGDLVAPSAHYSALYGSDLKLIFNVSAKKDISNNEIKGPTYFKKESVEYTIFLPFDVISGTPDPIRSAAELLLKGACTVFESLHIDTSAIVAEQNQLLDRICSDPSMIKSRS